MHMALSRQMHNSVIVMEIDLPDDLPRWGQMCSWNPRCIHPPCFCTSLLTRSQWIVMIGNITNDPWKVILQYQGLEKGNHNSKYHINLDQMKKSIQVYHWLPRIISILAILFIGIYALFAYLNDQSAEQETGSYLFYLIPCFVFIILLIASWNWELTGGILFILIGFALSPLVFAYNYKMDELTSMSFGTAMSLAIPFIVVGILFILSFYMKKRDRRMTKGITD